MLTSALHQNANELLDAASWMKWVVNVREAVAEMLLAYPPSVAANYSIMVGCDQAPPTLPVMWDLILLTLHWQQFSWWGRELVTSSFADNGGHYLILNCLQLMAAQIAQAARPQLLDVPLMLISRMGQGVCLSLFFDYKGSHCIQKKQWHTIVDIVRLSVRYLNVIINRTTRQAEAVMRPDKSTLTRGNRRLVGTGTGLEWQHTAVWFLDGTGT